MAQFPPPSLDELARFLTDRLGDEVHDVTPLGGGLWAQAYAFDDGDRALVLRLGDYDEDFAKDRVAASWHQPGLPVPQFVELGEAFGGFYAITERATGQFLDQLDRAAASRVLPSLLQILDALRELPVEGTTGYGLWDRHGHGEHRTWPDVLLAVASERPRTAGWRRQLAAWPEIESVFAAGVDRLQALVVDLPSGRNVIHSDLVNRNVLVTDDEVSSVFDWGSSMYGDHLYDVAWLSYCSSYYTAGFDRAEILRAARGRITSQGVDPEDFDRRITCYELHIALGSLTSPITLRDPAAAQAVAGRVLDMLS